MSVSDIIHSAVKAASKPPTEPANWPEHPRIPGPPEPEPLPLDRLPPALRDWARSAADSVQVDPSFTALLALCSVSAAVAGKVVVRVDDAWDQEWVTLYGVVVAEPVERKSPAFRHMTEPIRQWESDARIEVGEERKIAVEKAAFADPHPENRKRNGTRTSASPDAVPHHPAFDS